MSSTPPDDEPPVSPPPPDVWPPAAYAPPGPPAPGPPPAWQPPADWAPYPYPVAPLPPRSSQTVWIVVAVLVGVVLLACSGVSAIGYLLLREPDVAALTPPSPEPSYPNPTGPPIQKHTGDLGRFVVAGTNKPVDRELADYKVAAKTFDEPATFEPLLTEGVFERGFMRRWVDADGTIVSVRVLQFGLTTFADRFADDVQDADEKHGWSDAAPVPGAGAYTLVRSAKEAGRIHSVGVLVKDELVVLVDTSQKPPNDPAKLAVLVGQEFNLLQ